MDSISRKDFLNRIGLLGASTVLWPKSTIGSPIKKKFQSGVVIESIQNGEDIFAYILRKKGTFDLTTYRQIIGAANEFKEGDQNIGVAAKDDISRKRAKRLLSNTLIGDLNSQSVYSDELDQLIRETTETSKDLSKWTMGELKTHILDKSEEEVKKIMPCLSSDSIGCLVKLMSNDELIEIGKKVFNPYTIAKLVVKAT